MNRLYHFPLSPFCRKVRLVMAEKRLEVELVEETYWEPSTEFLRRNPAGKVPVLKINNMTLSDSNAICEYLEETVPEPALMPTDPAARAEVRRLVAWFDDKFFHEVTRNLVYERVHKKVMRNGYPDGKAIKAGAQAIKFHIRYMDWLLDHRRWLAGERLSMADFAAAAQISCLDYISDMDWGLSTPVKDWYATMKSRPAFRSVLADQVFGWPQPEHYANLDF